MGTFQNQSRRIRAGEPLEFSQRSARSLYSILILFPLDAILPEVPALKDQPAYLTPKECAMPTRRLLLTLSLFSLLSLHLLAATHSFNVAPSYGVGDFPSAGAVGDVNNDGKQDVVTVNSVGGNLSALLGNGNGTFRPAISSGSNLGGSQAMVLADFNNDGFLDVATAGNPSTVTVLGGNGTGSFTLKGTITLAAEGLSLVAADFNGDGNIDLVAATAGAGVSVLLGNGDGTFQSPVLYSAGVGPNDVAVADFNGDGKLDLAVANFSFSSASVTLLLGNAAMEPSRLRPTLPADPSTDWRREILTAMAKSIWQVWSTLQSPRYFWAME